jgi:hypothetical protein
MEKRSSTPTAFLPVDFGGEADDEQAIFHKQWIKYFAEAEMSDFSVAEEVGRGYPFLEKRSSTPTAFLPVDFGGEADDEQAIFHKQWIKYFAEACRQDRAVGEEERQRKPHFDTRVSARGRRMRRGGSLDAAGSHWRLSSAIGESPSCPAMRLDFPSCKFRLSLFCATLWFNPHSHLFKFAWKILLAPLRASPGCYSSLHPHGKPMAP